MNPFMNVTFTVFSGAEGVSFQSFTARTRRILDVHYAIVRLQLEDVAPI